MIRDIASKNYRLVKPVGEWKYVRIPLIAWFYNNTPENLLWFSLANSIQTLKVVLTVADKSRILR